MTRVLANANLLLKDCRADVIKLIHHLDVWNAVWEQAFEYPNLTRVFGFHNHVNFPQEEVTRPVSLMKKFKQSDRKPA